MYKFRLAEERDLDVLLQMCRNFYAGHNESVIIPFDDDSTYLSLQQMLDIDNGMIVVACHDETEDENPPATLKEALERPFNYAAPVVGMVGFSFFRPPINCSVFAAREAMFWIEPEHRGGSLARTMLSVSHIGLRENGITHVYLTALANSPEAADKLYAAMGYTEVERSYVKGL